MASTQALPLELSLAIRSSHTQLNKLITARLPLCLPPYSDRPNSYVNGISLFSHLYTAIEGAWDQLLSNPSIDARMLDILDTLRTEGLRRSDRLSMDLAAMTGNLATRDRKRMEQLLNSTKHYEQDLRILLIGRPHLVLAWSWNMYLAIFNGGRYIRQALRSAGNEYWCGEQQLRFWEFDGDQDGEDVKNAFKKNFEIASQCLTRNERIEVVDEAKRVMAVCQEMVQVLDEWFETPMAKSQTLMVKSLPVAASTSKSASMSSAISALLSGFWRLVLHLSSSWKGAVQPTLETRDVHVDS